MSANAASLGARAPRPRSDGDEQAAYTAICTALLSGKMRPGTPLRERELAGIFGLTRGAVRKLLARLGSEGKLQLLPNRGAFVPQPSEADIRQIYEARKAVEAGIVAVLCSRISPARLALLRDNVRAERKAQRQGRRDESVRLAGNFHRELVREFDNEEIAAVVNRLVSRTQLFVALFEPTRFSGCAPDEHEAIVEALARGDIGQASRSMIDHLHQVEARVLANIAGESELELADILRASMSNPEGMT